MLYEYETYEELVIKRGVWQCCILLAQCMFNIYTGYGNSTRDALEDGNGINANRKHITNIIYSRWHNIIYDIGVEAVAGVCFGVVANQYVNWIMPQYTIFNVEVSTFAKMANIHMAFVYDNVRMPAPSIHSVGMSNSPLTPVCSMKCTKKSRMQWLFLFYNMVSYTLTVVAFPCSTLWLKSQLAQGPH